MTCNNFKNLTSSIIVYSGKRGVHDGLQQIPALPAGHARGTRPQILGGYRAAACEEEQVEELKAVRNTLLYTVEL